MKKTFEFTEQQAELLRKEQYKYLINDNMDHFLFLVQQIVSERITPEPGESIKPIPSIPIVGGGSVASDRTEPGESGQKRESPFIGEITISDLRKLFAHRASRITEDPNQGANQLMTLTDFRLALADMRWRIYNDGLSEQSESVKPIPSIPIVGGGSVASDRTEQCESFRPDVVVPSEKEIEVDILNKYALVDLRTTKKVYASCLSELRRINQTLTFTELNHTEK